DQALLNRVARKLRVPEDETGGRVHARSGAPGKRGESVAIAPPRLFHEHPLVHGRPLSGATEGRTRILCRRRSGMRCARRADRQRVAVAPSGTPDGSPSSRHAPIASRENSSSTTVEAAPIT